MRGRGVCARTRLWRMLVCLPKRNPDCGSVVSTQQQVDRQRLRDKQDELDALLDCTWCCPSCCVDCAVWSGLAGSPIVSSLAVVWSYAACVFTCVALRAPQRLCNACPTRMMSWMPPLKSAVCCA